MPNVTAAVAIAAFLDSHTRTWELAKATIRAADKNASDPAYQLATAADLAVLFGAGDSFAQSRGFDLDDLQAGFAGYLAPFDDGDRLLGALALICDVPEFAGLIDASFETVRAILVGAEPPSTVYCRLAITYEATLAELQSTIT